MMSGKVPAMVATNHIQSPERRHHCRLRERAASAINAVAPHEPAA